MAIRFDDGIKSRGRREGQEAYLIWVVLVSWWRWHYRRCRGGVAVSVRVETRRQCLALMSGACVASCLEHIEVSYLALPVLYRTGLHMRLLSFGIVTGHMGKESIFLSVHAEAHDSETRQPCFQQHGFWCNFPSSIEIVLTTAAACSRLLLCGPCFSQSPTLPTRRAGFLYPHQSSTGHIHGFMASPLCCSCLLKRLFCVTQEFLLAAW